LAQVLSHLPDFEDNRLLVGIGKADDAAVYQVNDKLCIIQTVDFFTPVVDDPYTFGAIAAANALSDVYAMGGKPVLALNIVGFPNCLPAHILTEILKGGADKVKEASAVLAGGHSIEDDEPKYGLSVMGFVDCDKILTNSGAQPGDYIALSKPLGTGILNTAIKGGMISEIDYNRAVETMMCLNGQASEIAKSLSATACTDVTGFGLLGHLDEMAVNSQVTMEIEVGKIPIIKGTIGYAEMGLIPGGTYKNRAHYEAYMDFGEYTDNDVLDICFDPQTSGGLLITVPPNELNNLEKQKLFKIIGRVIEQKEIHVQLK